MKKINVLGLTALFAAGGIGLAFNSPEKNSNLYTFGQLENGEWVELDPSIYSCEFAEEQVCMANFESPDLPAPHSTNWVSIEREDGIYKLKP